MTALGVLQRYVYEYLRPGQNDKEFKFDGPGLVIICRDETPKNSDDRQFRILTAVSASNDALAVAKRLLTQRANSEKYVYAMLASIEKDGERQKALAELAPMCIEGT